MGLGLGPWVRREVGHAVHVGGVHPRSERGVRRTREAGEAAVKRKHDRGMAMLVLGLAVRMRRLGFCLGKILRRPLLELASLLRKIGLLRWDRKSRVVVVGEAVAEDEDNRDVFFILVSHYYLFSLLDVLAFRLSCRCRSDICGQITILLMQGIYNLT